MENVNSQCLITMAEHSPRHGITILANLQYWETLMISERTAFFLNAPKTHLYARFLVQRYSGVYSMTFVTSFVKNVLSFFSFLML